MTATATITIRRACPDDGGAIVKMLADDYLGCARERLGFSKSHVGMTMRF